MRRRCFSEMTSQGFTVMRYLPRYRRLMGEEASVCVSHESHGVSGVRI